MKQTELRSKNDPTTMLETQQGIIRGRGARRSRVLEVVTILVTAAFGSALTGCAVDVDDPPSETATGVPTEPVATTTEAIMTIPVGEGVGDVGGSIGGTGGGPSSLFRYCKDPRPGWIVDSATCGYCADFALKEICNGRTCKWVLVQISDWEAECWSEEYAQ